MPSLSRRTWLILAGVTVILIGCYTALIVVIRDRLVTAPANGRDLDDGTVSILPEAGGRCHRSWVPGWVVLPGLHLDATLTGRRYVHPDDRAPNGDVWGNRLW